MPVHHDVVRCVASYLQRDPAGAMQCSPCLGPSASRWRLRSKLFPYKTPPTCRCDGRGFCVYTVDDASPRLTLRCTCVRDCLGAERALWAAACLRCCSYGLEEERQCLFNPLFFGIQVESTVDMTETDT